MLMSALLFHSLIDTHTDETGVMDFSRQHGSGMSKTKQGKMLISFLQKNVRTKDSPVFTKDELKQAANVRIYIETVRA